MAILLRIQRRALSPVLAHPVEVVLQLALLAMLTVNLVLVLWSQFVQATYPYQLDYGEGSTLYMVVRLTQGLPIYKDVNTRPWIFNNYTPLFMLLLAPVISAAGPAFWPGRFLSLGATVGSGFTLVLIVYRATGSRLGSAVAGLTFLALDPVRHWAILGKPDDLALLLSLLGILAATCRPRWAIPASVVLFTLAAYTKQSYLFAGPAAAFIFLYGRSRSKGLRFAAGLLGLLVGLGMIAQYSTGGWFFFDVVTTNANELSLRFALGAIGALIAAQPVLFGAAASAVLGLTRWPSKSPVPAFAVTAAATLFAVGKVGSNVNYFLEFEAAASMALGMVLADRQSSGTELRRFALLLMCVQVGMIVYNTPFQARALIPSLREQAAADREVAAYIAETAGPLVGDEIMGPLVIARRNVEIEPFQYTQLALGGKWDQTPFLQAIAAREFKAILIWEFLKGSRYTREMLQAVSQSYRIAGHLKVGDVWVPSPPHRVGY